MCGLAIHFYSKGTVCHGFDQDIKKRDSLIFLITFNSELHSWINTTDVIQKQFFVGLLLDDPCVIHKPIPKPGGGRQT